VHEADIEETPEGRVARGEGWFILNLGEMAWRTVGFGTSCSFNSPTKDPDEPGIGVHVHVLMPGEANGYYHAEEAQEGFLVLSGECIAVVEGEERLMRQWDYLHSPPGTAHITVGAGDAPCAILMFGGPDSSRKVEWIANDVAAKHGASVARTTGDAREAYEGLPPVVAVRAPAPFSQSD
jgi:mannose-6-phosphate isomerase-like protein (cupin superfamily)